MIVINVPAKHSGGGSVDWSNTMIFRSGVLRGNWILTALQNFVQCIFGRIVKHTRPIEWCLSVHPLDVYILVNLCVKVGIFRSYHWLQKLVLWRWHHQDAHWQVSGRHHCRGFFLGGGKDLKADSRYSTGNQLCPFFSRHISLLIWSRLCSKPAGNSWHLCSISHIGTSMTFCP